MSDKTLDLAAQRKRIVASRNVVSCLGLLPLLALAACGGGDDDSSTAVVTAPKVETKALKAVATSVTLTPEVAADASIDLTKVFSGGGSDITYTAKIGTGAISLDITENSAGVLGKDLQDGANTIIISAIDGSLTVTSTIVLTIDKSPTITDISTEILAFSNATENPLFDLATAFGGGSGDLTYAINTVEGVTLDGNIITFDHTDAGLLGRITTITITATDSDTEGDKESVSDELEFTLLTKVDVVAPEIVLDSTDFFPGYDNTANSYGATTEDGTAVSFTVESDTVTVSGLEEGLHTITVAETPTGGVPTGGGTGGGAESYIFVLGYDSSPTVALAIADLTAASTDSENATVDISAVFGGGTGALSYAINTVAGVSLVGNIITFDRTECRSARHDHHYGHCHR